MKTREVVGLDLILVKIWKCLSEEGLEWLTELFNVIFRTANMPSKWRTSIFILLYKNKSDIQDSNNYRGIKLLTHTMKLWQRIIERRLRRDVSISKSQFGLCSIDRQ